MIPEKEEEYQGTPILEEILKIDER